MRHTQIDLGPGDEVEIDRDDCACAPGQLCPPDDPFAAGCPRRAALPVAWLVMRGAATALYVRKLHPEYGGVDWTADRSRAHRFTDRGAATLVQEQIVARFSHAVAIVPESANERATAELNRVAEW